jgi:hypothetical protein
MTAFLGIQCYLALPVQLNRKELVDSTFAAGKNLLEKKQLCYLLAKHGYRCVLCSFFLMRLLTCWAVFYVSCALQAFHYACNLSVSTF